MNRALNKDRRGATHLPLQHRHFAFIAGVISKLPEHVRGWAAVQFANECERCNERFDRARFYEACNHQVSHDQDD